MEIYEKEKKKLEDFLKRKKLRLTGERTVLLEEILKTHGHFSAEEVTKKVSIKNLTISRASVYRNLNILTLAGIIRETAYGEKHKHYEHIYDEELHHHARCIVCHAVTELPCHRCEKNMENVLEKHGFQVISHELIFYGLCAECRQREKNKETNRKELVNKIYYE
jgi:Fur family transcriptional regulator, ferric uptake regulator